MDPKSYSSRLFCEYCKIKFPTRADLVQHNNVVHADKPYECTVCHKKFGERFTLKVHFRIHTGERPYVCSYCNKSFSQACNLTTHKKRYHFKKLNQLKKGRQVDTKRFTCPHCKIVFRRAEQMKTHVIAMHINQVPGTNGTRSPSTSSGVSSSSSTSESQYGLRLKQELSDGRICLHCHQCKLTFPDRNSYEIHRAAHQQERINRLPVVRPLDKSAILVSNSSGQKVNLSELVSKLKRNAKEIPLQKPQAKDVIQKLSGLGMEISLHPVKKERKSTNDLGLVISSVQSVSQSFFDELENRKPIIWANRPGPKCSKLGIVPTLVPRKLNGTQNGSKQESPSTSTASSSYGDRDPLELPTSPHIPPLKKPKLEPEEVILSSTRRSNRSFVYKEAEQPKHISIVTKYKNGKTTKRRIFPCAQCSSKFENIETRKMHFMTVHGNSVRKASPTFDPPPIMAQIITAIDHE